MSNARELAELGGSYGTGGFVGMKNRIINGAMMVSQYNGVNSVSTNSGYPIDRWQTYSSAGTRSFQQVSDAPTGFKNSLKVTTTSASAGATSLVQQWFEGYNVADFNLGTANAVTFTLTFWVKSSVTGTFAGDFANAVGGTPNRSYVFTYTINAANTWEQKTVTVTGDTSGTWATDNTAGLRVLFNIGTGGTAGTAGSWQAGDLIRTSSSVGIEGTLNATWQITGVQLEKGSTATSFDYRPYGTELNLCLRYYEILMASSGDANRPSATAATTSDIYFNILYKVNKRTTSPTVSFSAGEVFTGSWNAFTNPVVTGANDVSGQFTGIKSGLTANASYLVRNATITVSAEL